MTISQSSATPAAPGAIGHPEDGPRCSNCRSSLVGRHYHRISEDGGPTQVWCCICYFLAKSTCADWHPECKAQWHKTLPPRKFADGARVRHIKPWGMWGEFLGRQATVRTGLCSGRANWRYGLDGPHGGYAWVQEDDLEAVSSLPDTQP